MMSPGTEQASRPADLAQGQFAMVAMSHNGERALVADGAGVRFADGRALMRGGRAIALALVEGEAWVVTEDGGEHALRRFDADGAPLEPALRLGRLGADIRLTATRIGVRSALVEGDRAVFVREQTVEEFGARGRDRRVLIGGRGVAERRGGALVFRRSGALALPGDLAASVIVGGAMVLDGSAVLLELERAGCRTAVVLDLRRSAAHTRIRLGAASILAVAERTGLVVLGRGAHVALCDLRAGRCTGERILPAPVRGCAIDADGTRLLVLDAAGKLHALSASMADWTAPAASHCDPGPERGEPVAASERSERADEAVVFDNATGLRTLDPPAAPEPTDATQDPAAEPMRAPGREDAPPAPALVAVPAVTVTGEAWPEGPALAALSPRPPAAALDDEERRRFLGAARELVFAWCRTAAAVAEANGRLRPRNDSPASRIVAILDGQRIERPVIDLTEARIAEAEAHARFRRWNRPGAPHVTLQDEFGLSATAVAILWAVAAPQLWGELATAYGLLRAGGGHDSAVDELLLGQLLELTGPDRSALARELDAEAPLVRHRLISIGTGERPFAELIVMRAAVQRLAGTQAATPPLACMLEDIIAAPGIVRGLFEDLRAAADMPARIVLRGRRGSGRRTLAAALGHRSGRPAMFVEIRTSADAERDLARDLSEIHAAGGLPCVTIERDGDDDPAATARIGAVLDRHPGPLVVRVGRGESAPLAPGHHLAELGGLDAAGRRAVWRNALHAAGADPSAGRLLAARFDVSPGVARRVVAAAIADGEPADVRRIERGLRRHRAAQLDRLADRIEPSAGWDDVVLPSDMLESMRELVARVSLRGQVLDDWGLARLVGSARGITAMFQGGPGTGKTLAAMVIAGALGYELYRVDLSRLISKWVGETEKHLAELFDAAEDGECVLLFDEADSLFARRTEVKSSNDRHANVEVNYLLQRLDTFSGVAILTTNFGTSIDPAFKRRLSLFLQFPFPDVDERLRLWRAHVPATVPTTGELDFQELATAWQMSGGHIRNAAVRAAYLAAIEEQPLTMDHLLRAVRLEYRDRAKLAEGGRLD